MALVLDRARPSIGSRKVARWIIPVVIILTVALRIPFLAHSAGADEAGFLMVGSQWHGGGTSLYGNYWVDRPPLLILIFRIASASGGLIALRLIGCAAVAITIAFVARSAGLIGGPRAARWAAVAAAALCTTQLFDTFEIDGELLAAPFVAAGVTALITALKTDHEGRARLLAMAAGAAALAALLIKQNFADVFVFLVVGVVVAWHRSEITTHRAARLIGGFGVGMLPAGYVICLVTSVNGTSLHGVFEAMYPFRLQAGRVIAAGGSQYASGRGVALLMACALSGVFVLLAAVLWGVLRNRLRSAASWGLMAVLVFDAVSIALGGGYWRHYLVQLIVPLAIIAGVLVARRQSFQRPLVALVAVAALINWGLALLAAGPSTDEVVGSAIGTSADPGDTIVTAYGHATVDFSAGLTSPYQYLWSLPIKTQDPQLQNLDLVLTGPNAPTWFVTTHHLASWGLDSGAVASTIQDHYQPFGRVCGQTVYLHNGTNRPALPTTVSCSGHTVAAPTPKDKLS